MKRVATGRSPPDPLALKACEMSGLLNRLQFAPLVRAPGTRLYSCVDWHHCGVMAARLTLCPQVLGLNLARANWFFP